MQRLDPETETLISVGGFFDDTAHTLRAAGFDASEDGSGRGTPIIPILEAGKRCGTRNDGRDGIGVGQDGDPMFTLQSGAQHAVAIRTAQTSSNGCGINEDETAYTLDGANGQAVAFAQNTRDEVRQIGGDGQIVGALAAEAGMKQQNYIAFAQNQLGEVRTSLNTLNTLNTNSNASGRNTPMVQHHMAVRRLTPTECERLMGFSDGYTAVPHNGKPAADGPRYRALGNSIAVPVLKWIGERIAMVDSLLSTHEAA